MWRWYLLQGGPGSLGSVQQTEYDSRQGEWELRKCQTASQCQCDGETKSEVRIWPGARSGGHRAQVEALGLLNHNLTSFRCTQFILFIQLKVIPDDARSRQTAKMASITSYWANLSKSNQRRPSYKINKDGIMGEIGHWALPILLRFKRKSWLMLFSSRTFWSHLFSFSQPQPLNGDDFYQLRRWCF